MKMPRKKSRPLRIQQVLGQATRSDGRTGWRVREANGRVVSVFSSDSANTAMDEAVVKYGRALERLANR